MTKVKYLLFLYLILLCTPAYGTILMRNTFEEYEGNSLQEMGWTVNKKGNALLLPYEEDSVSYQTQRHGALSLHIKDPNDTSFATAYKTFFHNLLNLHKHCSMNLINSSHNINLLD